MAIWLFSDDVEDAIELNASDSLRSALVAQWERAQSIDALEQFAARLSARVLVALEATLDSDLRPPTRSQVAFARAIASAKKIDLSRDVLASRASIGAFLTKHGPRSRGYK